MKHVLLQAISRTLVCSKLNIQVYNKSLNRNTELRVKFYTKSPLKKNNITNSNTANQSNTTDIF